MNVITLHSLFSQERKPHSDTTDQTRRHHLGSSGGGRFPRLLFLRFRDVIAVVQLLVRPADEIAFLRIDIKIDIRIDVIVVVQLLIRPADGIVFLRKND